MSLNLLLSGKAGGRETLGPIFAVRSTGSGFGFDENGLLCSDLLFSAACWGINFFYYYFGTKSLCALI